MSRRGLVFALKNSIEAPRRKGLGSEKEERGKRKRSDGFGEVGDNKKLGFLEYPYISVCI